MEIKTGFRITGDTQIDAHITSTFTDGNITMNVVSGSGDVNKNVVYEKDKDAPQS